MEFEVVIISLLTYINFSGYVLCVSRTADISLFTVSLTTGYYLCALANN